jgi:hypothetical protein
MKKYYLDKRLKLNKKCILICFILLVQSCASPPPIDQFSIEKIISLTKVNNSKFEAYIKITGVDIGNTVARGLTIDVEKYYIRSNLGKLDNQFDSHQLYFEIKYSSNDWRFYNGANIKGGVAKKTTQITREVMYCSGNLFGACDYQEIIGVNFNYSDLKLGAQEGISVRLNTRYADLFSYVYLPPNYFQGYLVVLNKYSNKGISN